MNVLVDTTVLIDVLRGRRDRSEALSKLARQGSLLCSCDVTLAEVYAGMLDKERRMTEDLLDSLYYVPGDPRVARSAGLLRREWRGRGVTLSIADALIAALAMRHELALLTDNAKHFPAKGLVVWTPDRLG